MDTETRRRVEMGRRALNFTRANPDPDEGYLSAVKQLEEGVARADALQLDERVATVAERVANKERHEVRDHVERVLMKHVAAAAAVAVREVPDLDMHVTVRPKNHSHAAFRVAADAVVQTAQAHLDVLVKNGLSRSLLTELTAMLSAYDDASERSITARLAHIGARDGLHETADAIDHAVAILDGFNRNRYREQSQQLGAWLAASSVFGPIIHVEGDTAPPPALPPSGPPAFPPVEGESAA